MKAAGWVYMGVITLLALVVALAVATTNCTPGSGWPCEPIIWDLS